MASRGSSLTVRADLWSIIELARDVPGGPELIQYGDVDMLDEPVYRSCSFPISTHIGAGFAGRIR